MKKLLGIIGVILLLATYGFVSRTLSPKETSTEQAQQTVVSPASSGEVEYADEDVIVTDTTESTTPNESVLPVEQSVVQPTTTPVDSKPLVPFKDVTEGKYTLITVDGGSLAGERQSMAVVDIGYGEREYWAYTNEYGQLVRVTANTIILQDDNNEPVLDSGRYYPDEAKVPGTESEDLDEGHVIADSLGGVSNAYNITPQNSTLNRHGDQAYMEEVIRKAGGCTKFTALITYPDTKTQIPSHYSYTYTLKGNVIHDEFDNINPDEANKEINSVPDATPVATPKATPKATPSESVNDVSKVDTNGNGTVTIAEAKAAGYKMPITSSHWLYKYMTDKDGDGSVGE